MRRSPVSKSRSSTFPIFVPSAERTSQPRGSGWSFGSSNLSRSLVWTRVPPLEALVGFFSGSRFSFAIVTSLQASAFGARPRARRRARRVAGSVASHVPLRRVDAAEAHSAVHSVGVRTRGQNNCSDPLLESRPLGGAHHTGLRRWSPNTP